MADDVAGILVGIRPQDRPRRLTLPILAELQHGVVARWQLAALGYSAAQIKRLVREGHLVRVHLGVYAVGHRRLTAHGRRLAAVLACGPGCVLSHRPAGSHWNLLRSSSARLEVTVPRSRTPRPGIRVHLCRRLHDGDRTVHEGIPVTTIHRTILDLAEVLPKGRTEDVLETAERLQLLDVSALKATMGRAPGRHGLKPLRAWLSENHDTPAETRSELERRLVRFCRERRLDRPATNVVVAGYEVDCFWPDRGLVIELDSWEFHKTRRAFEEDRARDQALLATGYRTARVTSRTFDQPERLAALITGSSSLP